MIMRGPDDKLRQRLADAEQRLANLERVIETRAERPAVGGFPRETWLGETVAVDGAYPGVNANTFAVKLLSARFSPETPGQSSVITRDRGTVKICRTWPSRYYPRGSQVMVDHIRGVGNGGEWWIASPDLLEFAYLQGGNHGILSGAENINQAINVSNSSWWRQELTWDPVAEEGSSCGPVGQVQGGRLNLLRSGTYFASAMANFWLGPQSTSGWYPVNWSLQVEIGELNNTYARARGGTSGTAGGPHEHYITAQCSTIDSFNAGIINLAVEGNHYINPSNLWVYNWSLFLMRLGD